MQTGAHASSVCPTECLKSKRYSMGSDIKRTKIANFRFEKLDLVNVCHFLLERQQKLTVY